MKGDAETPVASSERFRGTVLPEVRASAGPASSILGRNPLAGSEFSLREPMKAKINLRCAKIDLTRIPRMLGGLDSDLHRTSLGPR